MHLREVEDVLRDIMEDPRFTGHQNYRFEEELNVDEVWLLGGEASAGVAFQIGQIIYIQSFIIIDISEQDWQWYSARSHRDTH